MACLYFDVFCKNCKNDDNDDGKQQIQPNKIKMTDKFMKIYFQ